MKRDSIPGLVLLFVFPTVWSQCHNTPLSLSLNHPIDLSLPSDATENGMYRNNLRCEWDLSSDREGLQLEFVTFDLQWSPDCIYDYLEIYTGSGDNEQRVDRWCGSEYPNYIVMSRGRIVFHTNDRVAASGFSIKVKFTMISSFRNVQFPITVKEKPLLLYAPFYGESGTSLSFDWKLMTSDPSMVIQIDYRSVCENQFQTVQVLQYNENFTIPVSSDLLYHACDNPFHDAVVSHVPHVLIGVETDSQGANKRFRLSISAVGNYTSDCVGDGVVHKVTVSQHPHFLLVPYWQNTRSESIVKSCQWHVTTDMANHVVAMEMLVYDLPPKSICRETHIAVYNGADNSSMTVVSACANSDKFSSVESPEMLVDVHVFQQYRSIMTHKKAFVMKIYALKMCEDDGLHPLVAKGDRSYAVMNYNVGPDCTWRIKADNTSIMKMVDVGVLTLGEAAFYNPVPQCLVANDTYLQVYKALTTLSKHQVTPACPILNAQDYRVYGTSLYLPTRTSVNMPRPSQAVYYYATKGICDIQGEVTLEATLTTQSLFSPNYPNLFWPHEHCRWRLHSFSPYYDVSFRVLSFTSENPSITSCSTSRSHIAFYDGYSGNSTRLTLRCAGLGSDWISSMGRYVYADFTSFFDKGGRFEILYKAVRSDSSCNEELQAARIPQNLSSPGFPSGADSNADCWWRIKVQSEDDVVYVKVLQTDMHEAMIYSNCQDNYVEAYDGKDANEGLIIRWCGTQTPSFVSTGKYMFLQFKTSSHDRNKGFLLTYNSTEATITRCGSSLKAFNYVSYLSSPNYPDNYKNHMDCEWNISADSLYNTVKIEVIDMHLEYDCSFDNVSIYDGPSSNGILLQTFCAQMHPTLQSTTRYMYIRFRSDSSRTHRGFRLKYYETEDSPPPLVCNKQLSSRYEPRYLESPGYPNLYPSNLDCWWIITSSDPSARVRIEVLRSALEYSYDCVNDYVLVLDGDANGPELGKFCGSQEPSYTSAERSVYIIFKTNTDKNEMGFRLKYITMKACVLGHVTDLSVRLFPDYIESPNYPVNYPNDVSCMWRLTTNISNYIQLTVIESDIESSDSCKNDYMAAYDGYNDYAESLDKWCGTRKPSFTSTGTVMFLKFRSDGSSNGKGFRLNYAGVNTGNFDSSSVSMKAGTVAGVVCGVFVVTSIMIAVIFIIVRHKHKNQRTEEQEAGQRGRRSRRNWRLRQYQERGPWEVNQVFYSQVTGDGLVMPPPYSLVVGGQVPHDPPPPYPAAEFVMKDDDEPAPPYQMENPQTSSTNGQNVTSEVEPVQGTSLSVQLTGDGKRENAEDRPSGSGGVTSDDQPASRPHPRPQPRPQPRSHARPQPRSDPQRIGRLDPASRAVSVDNLMPGRQPLSLSPSHSDLPHRQMSAQVRAVSVGNLLSPDAPQPRGYDRHVSQSEMVLNSDPGSPLRHEPVRRDTEGEPVSSRPNRHRPGRKPERPERQRDREKGRTRTRSEPDFGDLAAADDRSQPESTDRSIGPETRDRYTRNYKRNPNENQSRQRGRRSNPRSDFEDMKQRSRSCDNLNSDRLTLPSSSDHNPRWSVASEGYMNNRLSTSPTRPLGEEMYNAQFISPTRSLGEETYNNPRMSLATDQVRRAPRPTPRGRVSTKTSPGPQGGRYSGGSRDNLSQGQTSKSMDSQARPAHTGSRGNLSGGGWPDEVDEVSGYARNRGNVVLTEEHGGNGMQGQPTETSV